MTTTCERPGCALPQHRIGPHRNSAGEPLCMYAEAPYACVGTLGHRGAHPMQLFELATIEPTSARSATAEAIAAHLDTIRPIITGSIVIELLGCAWSRLDGVGVTPTREALESAMLAELLVRRGAW